MMQTDTEMMMAKLRTMALAAHLADNPNAQVKNLASQAFRQATCPKGRDILKTIVTSNLPAATVLVAYSALESEVRHA